MKDEGGYTHLEVVEEKGELMPRAVQARDSSADRTRSLGHRVLTSSR
jgi:hypothetical protein